MRAAKFCTSFTVVLWCVTLKIGALTKLGLFFTVVRFIHVFDQTLAEQLYRDKCRVYTRQPPHVGGFESRSM